MDNGIMPKMNTLCIEKGRGIMAKLACEKVPLANIVTRWFLFVLTDNDTLKTNSPLRQISSPKLILLFLGFLDRSDT